MKTKQNNFNQDGREAYEFLPAALEVLETPPVPFGRIIAITISAFFVLAVFWAWWGTIDVVAVSEGRTIPAGNVKIIQPLETGVVRAIHVKDGDPVKQGDLLLELDPTESAANLDALHIDLAQARMDEAIGFALLQSSPETAFTPPEDAGALSTETARQLIIEEHNRHVSSLQTIRLDNQRLAATSRASEIEQEKLEATLPLIEDRLQSQESLLERGITQKPIVQALQQEVIEMKAALRTAIGAGHEARASIEANTSRIAELTAGYRSAATQKRVQAQRQISLLEQSIRKEQQRLNYLELKAPVDGVVQQLSVHTIGAVVNTAEPLLVIVPENTPLEIESMILNKDIGFVESGQVVEIKFEAFPFTRYGTVMGKLVSVSNDAIIHDQLGPVYKAKVTLDSQQITVDGKAINLSPGMTASIEVKTGTRRIIEFFLSPLLRYKDEAIRER